MDIRSFFFQYLKNGELNKEEEEILFQIFYEKDKNDIFSYNN